MSKKQTITVYRARKSSVVGPKGQWRWRIQAANRVIIGASSEAFKRLSRCLDNLELVTGIRIWSDDYDKKFGDTNRFVTIARGRTTNGHPRMLA